MHLLFYTPFPWKIFFVMYQRVVEVVSGALGSVWDVNILLEFLMSWFFVSYYLVIIFFFYFGLQWVAFLWVEFSVPPLFFEEWVLLIPFCWGRCTEVGNFKKQKYIVNVSLVQPCQCLIISHILLKMQTLSSHRPPQNWWILDRQTTGLAPY